MENSARDYWNNIYACCERERITYDDWLSNFEDTVRNCDTVIVDLGCGSGNDTKYLVERGKKVIACDYSLQAVQNISKNFPEAVGAECFDMTEGLPFEDGFTELVIADLSLHYFTQEVTGYVLDEIKRILKPNGVLLARVNSVRDVNHGAGQGKEVEHHLYKTADGRLKRFFDRNDIERFFADWEMLFVREEEMTRYALPKILWTVMLRATE